MMRFLFFLIFLLCFFKQFAQFQFSGIINEDFVNSTAYLNIIDNFNESELFLTEKIIQASEIDIQGKFIFSGDFLTDKNSVYKIYLDKCNENISDSKHLLNQCEESISVFFIANNKDRIHFPLNDLSQMFCSIEYTSINNMAIHKIDSIRENLLINLPGTKSDAQRKLIYKKYFDELQIFSKSLNEPLAELYAFHIYSEDKSFSREFYIKDLKKSTYYNDLLKKMELEYPNSSYSSYYKEELIKDQYPLLRTKNKSYIYWIYTLLLLLIVSFVINFILFKRNKLFAHKNDKIIRDYKIVLSPQEQKVFELIHSKLTNKEIAEKLFISVSTVKTHINNIYSKLSISSRNEIHHFF